MLCLCMWCNCNISSSCSNWNNYNISNSWRMMLHNWPLVAALSSLDYSSMSSLTILNQVFVKISENSKY